MTFAQFNRKVKTNAEHILARNVLLFNADIKAAWPVGTPETTGVKGYVGGFSKGSWQISKKSSTRWIVSNNASYSGVLWLGRIGNKGSTQLENGGDPILRATEIRTIADMKRNLL